MVWQLHATAPCTLAEASRVELSIYDVGERILARVLDEDLPAGDHWALWNGPNESGEEVTSAVYFTRIAAGRSVRRAEDRLRAVGGRLRRLQRREQRVPPASGPALSLNRRHCPRERRPAEP